MATFKYYGNEQSKYYNKFILKNNTTKNDWSDLVKLIRLVNDSVLNSEGYLRQLESAFNLDKCLRAWAINNLIVNIDAYNMFYPHNFFLYHDSITFKWHWISLDGNYAFAAWNPVMSTPSLIKMGVLVPDSVPFKEERPLLDKTLGNNKKIQKRYLAIVQELLKDEFSEEHSFVVIKQGDKTLIFDPSNPVTTKEGKFPSIYVVEADFDTEVRKGVKRFVTAKNILSGKEAYFGVNDGTNIDEENII